MSRTNYGRAYRIREADVRSYERTNAPKKYRSNPMGVTTLMRVNKRGSGRPQSARAAARGKTPAQRLAQARRVMKGSGMKKNARKGHRAAFVSSMKKNAPAGAKRRGQRVSAYNSARRRGMSAESAARSAIRKVPFTQNERRKGAKFKNVKARMRANPVPLGKKKKKGERASAYRQRKKSASRKPLLRSKGRKRAASHRARKASSRQPTGKKPRSAKQQAASRRNIKKAQAKRRKTSKKRATKQYARVARTKTVTVKKKVRVKGRQRVAYGKYKRLRLTNPRTGKKQYSYMYRTKKGNVRRIPTSALTGRGKKRNEKRADQIRKGRIKAARRLVKHGGPFVANKARKKKGGTAAQRRAARRLKVYNEYLRKHGKNKKTAAAKYAVRKVKLVGNDSFKSHKAKGLKRKQKRVARSKKKVRKVRRGRKTVRRLKKGQTTKQLRARRRNIKKAQAARKKGKKSKRRMKKNPRRVTRRRAARMTSNRRRTRRTTRRRTTRRRRRYTRNQMGAMFKQVMKAGALITAGFLTHRLLTNLVVNQLLPLIKPKPAATAGLSFATFERPIAGAGVLVVGIAATAMATKRKGKDAGLKIGAGMFASWASSLLMSIFEAVNQPAIAGHFSGYANSRAYALRGMGAYGRRGSIMPRYRQVGQYQQAAAGMGQYRQAAAGWMGEYFQSNAVGEYFAPNSVAGVGQYEPAGPLAMQAAAGTGQVIDDGIRPDSNLDSVLDLAESAAGLRGGMGSYFTATPSNGGFVESRVPTQSQWVPNGPLWGGTLGVKDTQAQADLPAGILAGPGGNGVLSGQ